MNVVVLAGWVFFVTRLARTLLSGPSARRFLRTAVVLAILLSIWFIWSLHVALEPAQRITP